jgi:hypothetical protein
MIDMKKKNKMNKVFLFCKIVFMLYSIFNIIAMFFYTGGTAVEPESKGYRFFSNFFSDLGMIHSYNGRLNIVSAILFSSALVLMGIAIVLFFFAIQKFFIYNSKTKIIIRFTTVLGILSGITCAGIGFSPQDLLPTLHESMAYCFSGTFLFALVFFTISIFMNSKYARIYAVTNIVYMVILAAFIVLLSVGPSMQTHIGLLILATGQKITIYSGMICVFIQFIGASQYVTKIVSS